jgi:hypothetical protein
VVSSVIFDDGAFPGPPHPRPLSPKGARGELILPVTHLLERGELVCCPRPFGGEGGPHPAFSSAGAGRVRGSGFLSFHTADTTPVRIGSR